MLKWWPLAACVVAFGAGWTVQGWRWGASEKAAIEEALKQQQADLEKANLYSTTLEIQLAEQAKKTRDLQGRLTRETRHTAYRCVIPSSGVRLLDEARTGKAPIEPDR